MNNSSTSQSSGVRRGRRLLHGLLCTLFAASTVVTAFTPDASNNNKQTSPFIDAEIFTPRNTAQSRTTVARESAVLVEWERMSELERRLEDGVNYEHFSSSSDSNLAAGRKRASTQRKNSASAGGTGRGVFCGYRSTQEEHDRLKSADPNKKA